MADNGISPDEAKEFAKSNIWAAMKRKLEDEMRRVDSAMENPEPFLHGTAVGGKRVLVMMLGLAEAIEKESKNESPYQKIFKRR